MKEHTEKLQTGSSPCSENLSGCVAPKCTVHTLVRQCQWILGQNHNMVYKLISNPNSDCTNSATLKKSFTQKPNTYHHRPILPSFPPQPIML